MLLGIVVGIGVLGFFLSIIVSGDIMMAIMLMIAQAASTIEFMIGTIGLTLLIASLLIYQTDQDRVNKRLDGLEKIVLQWTEQYSWFEYYLKSAKLWKDQSTTLIFKANQGEMEKYWIELKSKTEKYNAMLEETYEKIKPLNGTIQQTMLSLRRGLENHYEKNVSVSLILALIGLGMMLMAIVLPGTDSMLGLIAGQIVDPALQGEERINAILRLKETLKTL